MVVKNKVVVSSLTVEVDVATDSLVSVVIDVMMLVTGSGAASGEDESWAVVIPASVFVVMTSTVSVRSRAGRAGVIAVFMSALAVSAGTFTKTHQRKIGKAIR